MQSSLTREEILWWRTPELWQRREQHLAYLKAGWDWCRAGENENLNHISYTHLRDEGWGLGPVGELPVLLHEDGTWTDKEVRELDFTGFFTLNKYWRFCRKQVSSGGTYNPISGQSVGAFSGPDDPTMTFMDGFLWVRTDPRTTDLEAIPEGDDTKRLCRFIQNLFQKFVLDKKPSVPSLWMEDGQLMCGWNDLYKKDSREIPDPEYPKQKVWTWHNASITDPHLWRNRLPRGFG